MTEFTWKLQCSVYHSFNDSTYPHHLLQRLFQAVHGSAVLHGHSPAQMTTFFLYAMLATRISFMNDIANLCDLVGANVDMVRKGIGADTRIGSKFLYPGCGYGGSCFPKDVKALARTAREYGYTMGVIEAVYTASKD